MSDLIPIPGVRRRAQDRPEQGIVWIDPGEVAAQARELKAQVTARTQLQVLRGGRVTEASGALPKPILHAPPAHLTARQRLMVTPDQSLLPEDHPSRPPTLTRHSWSVHQGRLLPLHAALLRSGHHDEIQAELITATDLIDTFRYNYVEVPALLAGTCVLITLRLSAQMKSPRTLRLPRLLLELAARASVVMQARRRPLAVGGQHHPLCRATSTLCLQALGQQLISGSPLTRLRQHGQLRDFFETLCLEEAETLSNQCWLDGPLSTEPDQEANWITTPHLTATPPAEDSDAETGLLPLPGHAPQSWPGTLLPRGPCSPEHAQLALRLLMADPELMAEARQDAPQLWQKGQPEITFPFWLHEALRVAALWPDPHPDPLQARHP